ncbi:hypothetical protein [Azohydromonas australica]|uniref:hypothetical protein n=1 Tax=Azohydromonas australica TaxID=364039 RepID=UPI0004093C15|nr:hypothetical protein [Azohydromonas australica]
MLQRYQHGRYGHRRHEQHQALNAVETAGGCMSLKDTLVTITSSIDRPTDR